MNDQVPGTGKPVRKFAFLAHMVNQSSLAHFDPDLGCFNSNQLSALLDAWDGLIEPTVVGRTEVFSKQGNALQGEFIALFKTTEQMISMDRSSVIEQLQAAVDLAIENGAQVIGLGGYTSIISNGGRSLRSHGVPLTTGNSFTAVTAIQAIEKATGIKGRNLVDCRVCIVGAAGSIGAALSQALATKVGGLQLVGNPQNHEQSILRLQGLISRIVENILNNTDVLESNPIQKFVLDHQRNGMTSAEIAGRFLDDELGRQLIVCSTSIDDVVPNADIVVACTSSPDVLITSNMVKRDAIICDLSVPHNLPQSFAIERPDVLLFDGGILRVPGRPDLGWRFGLERGQAFACMCETMLMAMEPEQLRNCAGPTINLNNIGLLNRLGEHHGFELEDFRCFGEVLHINQ